MNLRVALSIGVLGAVAVSVTLTQAQAADCTAHSPEHRLAVLELYTSEGCSSCPPADRFLRALPASGFGVERVIPLALHVDYWDYIGWKDRFAQAGFTERQRHMASLNGLATIYTPQFLVSGKEVRGWFSDSTIRRAIKTVNQSEPSASIELEVLRLAQTDLELKTTVTAADPAADQDALVYLAIYENGLGSEVERGENAGKRLQHDYVVRRLMDPVRWYREPVVRFQQSLSLPADWVIDNLAIVVFVQDSVSGEIQQAVRLELPCR